MKQGALQRQNKKKRRIKEDTVVLGLIQKVQEPTKQIGVAKEYKGKSDLGAVHVWREDMPECIKPVLKEYGDIFPQDLPPGLPPVRMGHEFRIDLEDDTPPVHKPLYKLSPLELEERISRFSICSSMGSSTLPTLRMAHQCSSHPRKTAAFGFASTTVG